ncbi:hypothetical protein [Capnocytophaga felis]|uniref:Uncharacterized protein n=1 Tax=Capnocytophaga felis TaxID=2267611 RepID=A0A5M4BAP0_9FLAO|nr:hypothetical protein [Capnocytophaga felis]GET46196.1 hypothetical protein RCZ01_14980 [Capnocytophaga felis]GET48987.1 hypothetical protein RCZ02_18180 [Capnocytophaga felis]
MWNIIKKTFNFEKKIKSCGIYKTQEYYKIITESQSETGLFLSQSPIFILPINCSINDFKNNIFQALNSSKNNVKMPSSNEKFKSMQKELLKDLKEKSFLNLYKNSTHCIIRFEKNCKIFPTKFSNEYKGNIIVEEDIIEMEYSPEKELEITEKIIEVLDKSYK